jgi:threonine dehydratase/serine racemase
MSYAATIDDIRAAAQRIAGWAHITPVHTCKTLDHRSGRALFFKCEQFQKVGAFKFRGAANAVRKLTAEQAARGVVTHSSGNHAQALALAAKLRGIPAFIVMPRTASPVKRRAVEDYGAQVIVCEPTQEARESTADKVLRDTGGTLIPPYNHADVIAGQGTVALEFLEQVPRLEVLVAPIGGGGLVSGLTLAAKALNPRIKIIAAEPLGADDAARSKVSGTLLPQTNPRTLADGLLTSMGDLTWPVVRDLVDGVITTREDEMIEAMRLLWERAKLLVETSSAVAFAAVLTDAFRALAPEHHVGIVLSGGNVNVEALPF